MHKRSLNKAAFGILPMALFLTLLVVSCSGLLKEGTDRSSSSTPAEDVCKTSPEKCKDTEATKPDVITGTLLTCGPVYPNSKEFAEKKNLYGCRYENEEGSKDANQYGWEINIAAAGKSDAKVSKVNLEPKDSYWNVTFEVPADFLVVNFEIKASVAINMSPKSLVSRLCPAGYVLVPGSSVYGTSDFCVMKFEAKTLLELKAGDEVKLESLADSFVYGRGKPNYYALLEGCGNIEPKGKFHMITNKEWMTIALNIAQNSANWNGSHVVGTGFVNSGTVDYDRSFGAGIFNGDQDQKPCDKFDLVFQKPHCNDPTHSEWRYKRTHVLSNNEVIWDFVGNLAEYVVVDKNLSETEIADYTKNGTSDLSSKLKGIGLEARDIYPQKAELAEWNPAWGEKEGMGGFFPSESTLKLTRLVRGGGSYEQSAAGLFSFSFAPDIVLEGRLYPGIGSRCVYSP